MEDGDWSGDEGNNQRDEEFDDENPPGYEPEGSDVGQEDGENAEEDEEDKDVRKPIKNPLLINVQDEEGGNYPDVDLLDAQAAGKRINPKERITPSFLTKYERARVIGKEKKQGFY